MKTPSNITMPFFAYGIFKPGQLCYPRINKLVEDFEKGTVGGFLKERDGIPLLVKSSCSYEITGFLINFNKGKEEDAYNRIIEIEPDEVYKWGEVKVDDRVSANALLGKREQRGSSDMEGVLEWDGKNDPLFKHGLEEVEEVLRSNQKFDWDCKSLFRLQMAYMLLWSAIERFAGLKYHLGKKATDKVYQIANEDCFADSLKKHVKEDRTVYGSVDLEKYSLDPNDPKKSMQYYYQVRSNSVHRGKAGIPDFDIVKNSLEELLAIFKDILSNAWKY